jgi:hypothetical protein
MLSLGEDSIPRYNAVLLLSFFSIFNFLAIIGFLMLLFDKIIFVDLPKILVFMAGLSIIGINSYLIFGGKRYLAIEETFANESRSSRIKGRIHVALYILGTIGFFIVSLICMYNHPIEKM